jgi:tRNA A-37 threonylcarbamoyl transferase component Bud32
MLVDVGSPVSHDAKPSAGAPRDSIVYHPRYERFLRRQGIDSAAAVLALRGEVLCGHPDRHVARVELGSRVVYLKREHVVGLRTRLRNRLAGFGWVSRSEREALTLHRLEAGGLPGPQWLAYGEDGHGRAFLLVDELAGMRDLATLLGDTELSPAERRELAARIGHALAELHAAGFGTPDLAAKHVFVNPSTFAATLIDWQSATRRPPTETECVRQLAALNASLSDDLATPRDRFRLARTYWRLTRPSSRFGQFVRTIRAESDRRRLRSSARDQRQAHPAPRLVWVAEEAVCVTPELVAEWPTPAICEPFYPTTRRTALPRRKSG